MNICSYSIFISTLYFLIILLMFKSKMFIGFERMQSEKQGTVTDVGIWDMFNWRIK